MNKALFIEVILPLALPQAYTYAVPFEIAAFIKIGQRVIVQFGKKRMYSALVYNLSYEKPTDYNPKLIESIADEKPIITPKQFKLWEWISSYYMCTMGEVMAVALPSALKLSSESKFLYNEVPQELWKLFNDNEFLVAEALQANNELSLEDIQNILLKKNVYPVIQSLMEHRICVVKEELQKKYKPKKISFIALNKRFKDENALQALFEKLDNKPKQLEVLLAYMQLSPQRGKVKKSDFSSEKLKAKKISKSSISTLIKNEILVESKEEISRLISDKIDIKTIENLSKAQEKALEEVKQAFTEKKVCVLEGITGSGKTHVYIKLIQEQINKGKQVLYLLPEIALTAQIVVRLQKYFGNKVGIYHSKFNENERVEIYQKVLSNEYKVILSARSGVFLPFQNLGLIIVDEEHERSYKQFDPSPRYHARDISIIMSSIYNINVLLGSATLSLETYRNVHQGKFALVQLMERFGDAVLPEIEYLNTIDLRNRKKMNGLFSQPFINQINTVLDKGEQLIIFQNRRGYANYLNCTTCNWIPYCPNCDVSLTYHKFFNKLVCHYCGHSEAKVENCKACGSSDLNIKGIGTEQIEEEINLIFPNKKTARLDLDTTRRKHGHEEIIFAFQNKEIDILIGTQMVTKGLDFDNVTLVGIVNADLLISFPDFRASERAFQLITQVSGRAGRKKIKGKVLIQTGNPENALLQILKDNRTEDFYYQEMLTRKQFHFPPFINLIQLTIKHKQAEAVRDASIMLADLIRNKYGNRVLGPTTPIVSMIRLMYLRQILVKVEKDTQVIKELKQHILESIAKVKKKFATARIVIDVDP